MADTKVATTTAQPSAAPSTMFGSVAGKYTEVKNIELVEAIDTLADAHGLSRAHKLGMLKAPTAVARDLAIEYAKQFKKQ